jgi:hemerythrin-like metal-binding protein
VEAQLAFLARYLETHFQVEERSMDARGYPGLLEHARAHAALLARLGDARRAVHLVGSAARVLKEVVAELEEHLANDDQKLARFHAARESLKRLAANASRTGVDAASAALEAAPPR